MKFIQRILSHSVLIIVIALAVLAWVYRAEILPEQFGSQATVSAEKVTASASDKTAPGEDTGDAQNGEVASSETAPSNDNDASESKGLPPIAETRDSSASDLPPMADAQSYDSESAAPDAAAAPTEWTSDPSPMAQTDSAQTESAQTFRPDASMDSPSATDSPSPVAQPMAASEYRQESPGDTADESQDANNDDHSQVLMAARQAFWQRDLETAEQYYQEIVNQSPDDADSLGELGNLYYQQRRWEQAADAYFRAGKILAGQGKSDRSMQLLRVLWDLSPDKARQLEVTLSQGS